MKFDTQIYAGSIYDTWLRCANERDLLKALLSVNRALWLTHNPTNLLDVGCGSGAAGLRVMEIADAAGVTLNYTGIDPYANQLEEFQVALGTRTADLRVGTIESLDVEHRWDVVMAVHSLYYVPELRAALQKLGELGDGLILVHHGERGINEVHHAFREQVMPGPHIVSTYHDVEAEIALLGWEYDLHTFASAVDVSACKNSKDPAGRNLIRFFFERANLGADVFARAAEWFQGRPDSMVHDVGVFFVRPRA